MNEKIQAIESKLVAMHSNAFRISDKEEVFNLGVQLGLEMQRVGALDYKCQFWERKTIEAQKNEVIRQKVERINDFLFKLVKLAIQSHIESTGDWSVAKRNSGYGSSDAFDEATVGKFNIQLSHADMESYGGEIEATFSMEGELLEIFERNNIYPFIVVGVANDTGEEERTIYRIEQIEGALDYCNSYVKNSNEWEAERYEEFLSEISKPFTFLMLQQ